jgi:hypothetical protein
MPELPYGAAPVPVTPLADVRHWQFRITCRKCRRKVVMQVADIIKRHGPKLPIYEAVARLRCNGWTPSGTCRARPAEVVLAEVYTYGKSTRVARQIDVLPAASRSSR